MSKAKNEKSHFGTQLDKSLKDRLKQYRNETGIKTDFFINKILTDFFIELDKKNEGE